MICEAGKPGDSLFVVSEGLARVLVADPDGSTSAVARLRRGDVIGEMSLLTGEPRSATVVAATETTALELARDDFAALISRFPHILLNLNRILSRRLAAVTARTVESRTRGEAVALLVGESAMRIVPTLLTAVSAASPGPVTSLDARLAADRPLSALDDLLANHRTVVLVADLDAASLPVLIDAADRTVAVVGTEGERKQLAAALEGSPRGEDQVDVVVFADTPAEGRRVSRVRAAGMRVIRVMAPGAGAAADDVGWLGRHLSRTKVGLALGAGGAKGYAHIGALSVLEGEGYTVDYVSGSSIGAMVGAWLALGMNVAEIDATMRRAFRAEDRRRHLQALADGPVDGCRHDGEVLRESTSEQDVRRRPASRSPS